MNIEVFSSKEALGLDAARDAINVIRAALAERGDACIVAATGASQFEFLRALVSEPDIAWEKVVFFHLDEYIGLPESHPASFRRYLSERITNHIRPAAFHFINGESRNPQEECRRLGDLISRRTVDAAFVGIGENGHLAFNDPPADFETEEPYIVVELDDSCRRQQVGEGWFKNLDEVPRQAITMSVKQILKARHVLSIVPEGRKAEAVRNCLKQEISPLYPASALRRHPRAKLYLDNDSAFYVKA